jgi:signal transduction histidine kinase
MRKAFLDPLPRGYALEEQEWQRRHRLLLTLLTGHVPALAVVGGLLGRDIGALLAAIVVPAACAALGALLRRRRRAAAITVTLGLVYCSAALVGLTGGAIEAHFHFFVIIGFIALYQDWITFLFMILFTTTSHVVGSYWQQDLIFNHAAGQANPWLWSLIHGVAVLVACVGIVLLWNVTGDVQEKIVVARREADEEVGKRKFTHDLLVNLARRNQSMLYRQLEIINRLEDSERDPDTLSELFALDHLATRVRRNAESLLVLSGEQPQRVWTRPVPLRDVLRAAIAETEDLDRVVFVADEELAVAGHTVTDLTHLIAELTENAVRFSPPDSTVSIRVNPNPRVSGGYAITVEDWGVGMPAEQLAAANELLARPSDVDLSVAHRLGFHVVSRLATRHYIVVSLSATPSSGITATILLPPTLFTGPSYDVTEPVPHQRPQLDDPNGSVVDPTAARPTVPASRGPAAAGPAVEPSPVGFPVMKLSACPAPVIRNGAVVSAAVPGSNGHPVIGPADQRKAVHVPTDTRVPPVRTAAPAPARTVEQRPVATPEERWPGWWTAEVEGALPEPSSYGSAYGPDRAGPGTGSPAREPSGKDRKDLVPSPRPRTAAASPLPPQPDRRTVEPVEPPPVEVSIDPVSGLRRRIPQAHLAPGLRRSNASGPPDPRRPRDHGADAADALTRYQAARTAVQDGHRWAR